ncbi:pitrilysin family protein [Polaribacter undariae]|uniref:Pitrilysin family protein n=1 Tax=Polaribacter sejongensis TaxID=985043 RepID=A0AAJ1QZ68_9FLAO|nr:pitrilysin family protein [Polaribacter undariae]MDN3621023.1 pitrilysin family protein [Polaribacter undariae]UWD31155.1 insulinase family protein [Polaribacter undariae]
MKKQIISLIALIAMSFATTAQIDRSQQPKPGPAPKVQLGKSEKFTLSNGLQVIMVENHKLPRASANLTIDNRPVVEGDKAGVSTIMGSLLGRGTENITKDEFNEKVDFLGAGVNFYSSGASARSLTKYFPEVLELMADGVKNSQFTQEEFDKEIKITLDGLKSDEKNVTSTARRVESALLYGKNHPYGEFIAKETVNNITLEDVKNNYNTYYKPNNAYLIIVGDINPKETKKLVKSLFKKWKKSDVPEVAFTKPENVSKTEINFINMPNAVQSEVVIANNIDLKLGDKDYYAALLANNILGGGGTARLFMNLREDKGYTYGSYSSVRQSKVAATFRASASVRNVVTDSSIVEIKKEIDKIRAEKVTEEELKNAKAQYVGNFVMDVQKPATAASFALNIARYNLPTDFYENYLTNINAVTAEDVQNAALKYFKSDEARIIVTGKAIDVLDNLEKTGYTINYFDKNGNTTEKPEMTIAIPEGVTASSVIDSYIDAIGGEDKLMAIESVSITSAAKVQGMDISLVTKTAAPNKSVVIVSGMGQVLQKMVFDGETGYQEARGNKKEMTAEEITKSKAKNTIIGELAYKEGELLRIEPLEDSKAYVIKYDDKEIFFDVKSGLKLQEVQVVKTPDGKEVRVPSTFSNYKEVKGVKFPFSMGQKMGPMDIKFEVTEIKINEGVTNEDFK